MEETRGIYIHIPFCTRMCFYCNFIKYRYTRESVNEYLQILAREISLRSLSAKGKTIDTIYFGGGSPSLLTPTQIEKIFNTIVKNFHLSPHPEISMEINPEDCNDRKLKTLKRLGFSRLSIGIQSFVQKDLLFLKRNHDAQTAEDCIKRTMNSGFPNINIDFLIGLPTQSSKSLKFNLTKANNLNIPHISVYLLEGVKGYAKNEKKEHNLYYYAKTALESRGYIHYEISNYAREKYQCRHNLKYWQDKEYIGIGVSASGYENKKDYKNHSILSKYREALIIKQLPLSDLNEYSHKIRRIVTGFRLIQGIPLAFLDDFAKEKDFLISHNYLKKSGNRVYISGEKLLLLNEILTYFV